MQNQILFDPLLTWPLVYALGAAVLVIVALSIWRGLAGWPYRLLAGAALLAALANPSLQSEEREPLSDIVLIVVDASASQRISDRPEQTEAALSALESEIEALGMESRLAYVDDAEDNSGTLLMTELQRMMAEEPRARVAGALLITDGRLHDPELVPDMPAPIHALITGRSEDWDRRLVIETAPAFGIIGEELLLTLRIEDQGAVPVGLGGRSDIVISVDGGPPQAYVVPVGESLELPLTLEHAGQNVVQFTVPDAEGELTNRNNAAVVQINGIRDRLRVLLVSGEPHPGQRTWRNLLKSDPSVDLVHFTILRPPDRQDGVPVSELSLIAFPTRELFMEAVDEFDLIIFDRYQRRGILPMLYIDNIRALCGRRRRAAGGRWTGFRGGVVPLPHALGGHLAGPSDGAGDRGRVSADDQRIGRAASGDDRVGAGAHALARKRRPLGALVPPDRVDGTGGTDRDDGREWRAFADA